MDPIYNQTVLNPLAFLFVMIMGFLALTVKKKYAFVPFLFITCFITSQQRIALAGLDFTMYRIFVIFYAIRSILRKEWNIILNKLDKIFITYIIFNIILNSILWGFSAGLVNRLGFAFEVLGIYFFAKNYIPDIKELNIIIKWLIFLSIFVALAMLFEQITRRNIFGVLGGVPNITEMREGKLRSQGAFAHSIMAGTFGASLLPLIWGYSWQRERSKKLIVAGIIASVVITVTSSSSGPAITLVSALMGLFFWFYRNHMKFIFRFFVLMIVILHLVMKAPVWHLISRIDIVGGSTGYHRFLLIDATINNFASWFLVGIKSTAVWGRGLFDITNQYVLEAVRGGIVNLILFISFLTRSFKYIGTGVRTFHDISSKKYVWSLGAALFCHMVSFIGVSYFGQMLNLFYLLLAMISSIYDTAIREANEL